MKQSASPYLPADLALLYAATMWGLFWYPLRLFEGQGMPAIWVTLVAFSTAIVAGLVITRGKGSEYRRHPLGLVLIGLAAGWCNVSFLVAVAEGNAIRVVLLFYLSPVWTVILGHYILKETISLQSFLIFVIAFAGAMVMLWDDTIGFPWPRDRADWLALSSGISFALSNVLIRAMQGTSIVVKTNASWIGCVVIAATWVTATGIEVDAAGMAHWYYAIVLGVFGIVTMTLAVQYGVTHMPVYRSAIILLFEIPVTALSVYWLAGETMTTLEWLGGVIVIVSAILIARRG